VSVESSRFRVRCRVCALGCTIEGVPFSARQMRRVSVESSRFRVKGLVVGTV